MMSTTKISLRKVIETDEKVFRHNVSLTYEQWLVYPDGRKACFELRKVPFYDRVWVNVMV
jgi:two-component system, OmpR family, aerobic respiration control sensor histidine kinase ArcB